MAGSISQAEYARHRGCARSAVHQAIRNGRLRDSIVVERHGGREIKRISSALAADAEWEKNTLRHEYEPAPLSPKEAQDAALAKASRDELHSASLTEVRRRLAIEQLEAKRLQREAAERQALVDKGEMILASKARADIAQLFAVIRLTLRQVPARIAQHHPDLPKHVLHDMQAEIDVALTDLADMG